MYGMVAHDMHLPERVRRDVTEYCVSLFDFLHFELIVSVLVAPYTSP